MLRTGVLHPRSAERPRRGRSKPLRLVDFKGTVLFASHDHQFIQTIANRIIEILPDGKIVDKLMTYDEYIEYKHNK